MLIEHNKSVDDRAFASIFNSTRVRLTANHIRARVIEPAARLDDRRRASAIFIGARNDDIVVQQNKVKSTSGNGIDITNTGAGSAGTNAPQNVIVRENKVEHAQLSGIAVSATGAGYQVLHNRSLTNGLNGIQFVLRTEGGIVTGNTALGNGTNARGNGVDCSDLSAGLLNDWTANVGTTAEPRSICGAPTVDDGLGHDGEGHDKQKSKKHHKKTRKQKKHRPDPCVCTLPWRF